MFTWSWSLFQALVQLRRFRRLFSFLSNPLNFWVYLLMEMFTSLSIFLLHYIGPFLCLSLLITKPSLTKFTVILVSHLCFRTVTLTARIVKEEVSKVR